jgi:hypothetical protein
MSRFTPMSNQVRCPECQRPVALVALVAHLQSQHPQGETHDNDRQHS